MRFAALALLLLVPISVSDVYARVTKIEITRRALFAEGIAFGSAGAYERIVGRFRGELDPDHPANTAIVDRHRAPRNARGRIEYSADFDILKPVDPAKGNGTLLYEVANRGSKLAFGTFNDAANTNDPIVPAHAGNGFLLRHGFTLVWSGWEPGLPDHPHLLRINVPHARGVRQLVWDEILFNSPGRLSASLAFRAVTTDKRQAALFLLLNHRSEPRLLDPAQWDYVDDRTIRLLPAGRAFPAGIIFQFVYPASDPPVSGIGFAATRDFVSFLRSDAADNPLASARKSPLTVAIAHGNSQGGRYLRSFLYRGFNQDEAGRRVFDGMNPHLAAARIFMNEPFSQPSRAASVGHGFRGYGDVAFPFAYGTELDPYSNVRDGLLGACLRQSACPKIMHTSTSSEYWQSGNSLVTTDPLATRDAHLPPNVRVYHFASTQHSHAPMMPAGTCASPGNYAADPRPGMRALLLALDAWVRRDAPPPSSSYPRLSERTLVDAREWQFPAIPGLALPVEPNPRERFVLDRRPNAAWRGLPIAQPGRYAVRVPATDSDGNELAGIRMPQVAVPRGTMTGWSVRTAEAGSPGELCYLEGSYVPFARTELERRATGDPRPSIEARYRSQADYVAKLRAAAVALKNAGYMLEDDVQAVGKRREDVSW